MHNGNIITVVQIKNRFKNVSSNMSLQLFDYCDVKLIVSIEYIHLKEKGIF